MDYHSAFELAPIGLALSRDRLVIDCNAALLSMFGAARHQIVGSSFELLYPSVAEYESMGRRIAAQLDEQGRYADDRVMRRLGGDRALFWCHVSGRALDRNAPHAAGIWAFEDLSARRKLELDL
ncbi:MAG: PAS domain-containing protein, partial [Burkholderiales bacterium]|nr:PAS domain-containing protein [Burkholderiales bacterium]